MAEKTLNEQLLELKTGLETYTKTQVETEIKQFQENIKKLEGKADKEELASLQTTLNEIKAASEEIKNWKVTKDEADTANQKVIDEFIAGGKKVHVPTNEVKSFGDAIYDALNEGDSFKKIEMLATGHKDRNKRFTLELKTVGDMSTANVTTTALYGSVNRPGITEKPKRKVHVRDIVPVGTIGPGNTFTFMRENGNGEGAIATVAEGAAKPQLDFDLVETTINVETIAGWVRVTKKAMNNIPGFVSFLQSRLPEKLLRVEDAQLLTGNGVSPNISGITNTGNFIASTSAEHTLILSLIDDIALLEDTYEREATAILIRPAAYYSLFKNVASGSGEFDLPSNVTFTNGQCYISGIPAYPSTAVTAGQTIVGDFRMGAQLLIQNAMRLEFFEQDADNVTKNKITVRIEEDIAFPIYGPDYFVVGTDPDYGS